MLQASYCTMAVVTAHEQQVAVVECELVTEVRFVKRNQVSSHYKVPGLFFNRKVCIVRTKQLCALLLAGKRQDY